MNGLLSLKCCQFDIFLVEASRISASLHMQPVCFLKHVSREVPCLISDVDVTAVLVAASTTPAFKGMATSSLRFNTVIICDYWSGNQKELDGTLNWVSPDYGFKTAILSGGFTFFGEYLKRKLGIDYVYSNELEIVALMPA